MPSRHVPIMTVAITLALLMTAADEPRVRMRPLTRACQAERAAPTSRSSRTSQWARDGLRRRDRAGRGPTLRLCDPQDGRL